MRTARILLCSLILLTGASAYSQITRKPEVAGQFYPLDQIALSDSIDRYLSAVPPTLSEVPILGIIAPHAGYDFSGRTAAYAYRQIARRNARTVFVLGPSHHQTYQGAALHSAQWWETPLGKLPVDTAVER